jgi:hypothetical protein
MAASGKFEFYKLFMEESRSVSQYHISLLLCMLFASFIVMLLINWSYNDGFLGVKFGGCSIHVLCMFQVSESVGYIHINQEQSQTLKAIRKYSS